VPPPQSYNQSKRGQEVAVLKQKIANLESQLISAENLCQESELTIDTLKRQMHEVQEKEQIAKQKLHDAHRETVAQLQQTQALLDTKEKDMEKMANLYAKRIANLESQLSQRDAHLAFGGDVDLEEENFQLQEENATLAESLRKSQALVQELRTQLLKTRREPKPMTPRDLRGSCALDDIADVTLSSQEALSSQEVQGEIYGNGVPERAADSAEPEG
jgi:chromosome segregation ATPase